MRVLGVDPGLTRLGWAVIDVVGSRAISFVAGGVLTSSAHDPPAQRLAALANECDALVREHAPQVLALERVFAQHNVRTVMGTAQVSGVVMAHAHRDGLQVALYTPSEVKAAVTGHGRATKAQVTAMVTTIAGLATPPKPADAADALAIAITHAWKGGASVHTTAAQRQWLTAQRAARRAP